MLNYYLHLYDIISLNKFLSGDREYPLGNKNIIIISLIFFKNSNSFSSDIKYEVECVTGGLLCVKVDPFSGLN